MELIGFPEDVKMELYKLASVSLCSNTGGQLMVGLMVNPPRAGDPSYESFEAERTGILSSLRRRALKLSDAFNKLDGVSCQTPQGALYTFPSITLPPRAIDAATKMGKAADAMYCLELLDSTGVVVVPVRA
ncbi:unnamed protein product [Symbiodinium sp. KB8]|nr:unnamed protein product [Symbiodinium sp. KB8]